MSSPAITALVADVIARHETPTSGAQWDGAAAEAKLSNDAGAETYRTMYAWVDPDADADTKGAYKFPHHEVSTDGTPGAANTTACSAGIGALNGGRGGTDIPEDDREGVHKHLAGHLRDADLEPPELLASALRAPENGQTPCSCQTATTHPATTSPPSSKASSSPLWVPGLSRARLSELVLPTISPTLTATAQGSEWHARAIVEGVRALSAGGFEGGFEAAIGSLKWRDLPLPILLLKGESMGHLGSVVCGTVDGLERQGTEIMASGHFDTGAEGVEAERLVRDQIVRWVSPVIEIYSSEYVEVLTESYGDETGPMFGVDSWNRVTKGRIMGLTICPFPALPQLVIAPADQPLPLATPTNGLPTLTASGLLNAEADLLHPPAEWFSNPTLPCPAPLTVTREGRVLGHLAAWGTCHTGYTDRCVTPPHSPSGYAHFHVGGGLATLTADGAETTIRSGVLTMGCGHASTSAGLTWRGAQQHYDDVGYGVADVVTGEDEWGIWFSGALRPTVTPDQLRVLKASSVSGDWRTIGGALELVATLVVNVPGFPIPGAALAASAAQGQIMPTHTGARLEVIHDQPVALVGAGVVQRDRHAEAVRRLEQRIATLETAMGPLRAEAVRGLAARVARP